MLTLSEVDRGFRSWSGKTKDDKIGIYSFSIKQTALRSLMSKNKDWLAQNQDNMSVLSDLFSP
jgi:hypothetical protein